MTSDSSNAPKSGPLPTIHSPADRKALPLEQLPDLAEKIRRDLIETLAETGGHLGPNLGVVELSIAMHRVFDTPKDKFVFDVAHQAYIHKMLTGRGDKMHTIRQYKGLNGFCLRSGSEQDGYGACNAGTALSAGRDAALTVTDADPGDTDCGPQRG